MTQGNPDEKKEQPLWTTFRCNIERKALNDIDTNNNETECMTLSFVHKQSRQIYETKVTVSDCQELIKKVPLMPIEGLLNLLHDALSDKQQSKKSLQVNWKLSDSRDVLHIDVVRKGNEYYIPDVVFPMQVQSKTMTLVDRLQIRVEELEQENVTLKQTVNQQLAQMKQTIASLQRTITNGNNDMLCRNAVSSNADTGLLTSGGERCVLELELPQIAANPVEELEQENVTLKQTVNQQPCRNAVSSDVDTGLLTSGGERCVLELELPQIAGRFVARYSVEIRSTKKGLYFSFKLGGNQLSSTNGLYLFDGCESYPMPISHSYIVTLNGNETAEQRNLGLYLTPHATYPGGMAKPCIEYYQLPN
eukprot:CAMPEP_0202729570 /NCGR_PEP_ID=MMETSP1385-20130828/186202_1 /ASSEMBLY_ACC=CAM_ASM_000861 /TAXON_ID=933848 /ORGANISM="Elphidium margaritaceum" /LENGTH=362 /DNA_ID=CAMNT_0049395837 /DNA_START=38 /DNA_END=1127 /DNA_ORIENTATION=+